MPKAVALAGGVGAAKFLQGLVRVVPPEDSTVVGNVGDNIWLFGVYVAPDLDIVTYALGGVWDREQGWGIKGDSYRVRDALTRLGSEGAKWFGLGDRDFATCAFRTESLRLGQSLSEITDRIRRSFGVATRIFPATNEELTSMVKLAGGWVSFEEYYVRLRSEPVVEEISYRGAENASLVPGIREALQESETIFVCPSNPVASIAPILAVAEMRELLAAYREKCICISPLVGGKSIKGPADKMMMSLGYGSSVVDLARFYQDICSTLVIDTTDAASIEDVEKLGLHCVALDTIMTDEAKSAKLVSAVLNA